MTNILQQFLSLRSVEYLELDDNFTILETTPGIHRFADAPQEVKTGKDVRLGFPEIIGLEDILMDILKGRQSSFELKGIERSSELAHLLYIDLSIISEFSEESVGNRLILFFEDVTERMILQQSLVQRANEASIFLEAWSASSDYLHKVIMSMADALVVTNLSGTIETVNRATQELFGYSEEELLGKDVSRIITDENFIGQASNRESFNPIYLKNIETVCQTKTGEKISVAFSCSTLQSDLGEPQSLIYVGRDITERQRLRKRREVKYTVTRILSESATPSQTIPKILQGIGESLQWDFGELWMSDEAAAERTLSNSGTNQHPNLQQPNSSVASSLPHASKPASLSLECVETWVKPSLAFLELIALRGQMSCVPGVGFPGRIVATRSPSWICDVVYDTSILHSEAVSKADLHGAIGFPIQYESEILGVMIFFSREVQPIDEELLEMMAAIGRQIGQFIRRVSSLD